MSLGAIIRVYEIPVQMWQDMEHKEPCYSKPYYQLHQYAADPLPNLLPNCVRTNDAPDMIQPNFMFQQMAERLHSTNS